VKTILVTGGAGYIGSHTCLELLTAGFDVAVVDNLSNASQESLQRVQALTGKSLQFHQADIRDASALAAVFKSQPIDAVIHFAGLKAVGEVKNLVFSSSATVYGDPASLPITEDFPIKASNPYGWAKVMIEQILLDL